LVEVAAIMVAETTVSGSSFSYSAVAEMDSDLVETTVAVVADATMDAASIGKEEFAKSGLFYIFLLETSYILTTLVSGGTYGRTHNQSNDTL